MKTESQFRDFTPWDITQIPNFTFTPYMEIGSSPTSGSNLRLVHILKETPSHQQGPNQCLTYVCLMDRLIHELTGLLADGLTNCPTVYLRKQSWYRGWRSPDSIPSFSSDEPLPLAQEACPQAQTSLIPLSRTGLPHLALTCLQDPCI